MEPINNGLKKWALIAMFIVSYIPLFIFVIAQQIHENWDYVHWAGICEETLSCFGHRFGMSALLGIVSFMGIVGFLVLIRNIERKFPNGDIVYVKKIENRNSESIGYIATYIVPFIERDFSNWFDCVVFVVIMVLIYTIYVHSNMILINPLLNIKFSLLEIDYSYEKSDKDIKSALVITKDKYFEENTQYKLYNIGFKLFYGKRQ